MVSPHNPFSGALTEIRRCLHQGRGPAATDAARPILESDKAEAIFAAARLFYDADMADASVTALKRCTELDPGNRIYRLVLARTFEKLGLLKKSGEEYRAVLVLDADNVAGNFRPCTITRTQAGRESSA